MKKTLLFMALWLCSCFVFAQHGKYNEKGMSRYRPLTIFVKDKNTSNMALKLEGEILGSTTTINTIRYKVNDASDPFYLFYQEIFKIANQSNRQCDCNNTNRRGVSEGSKVAKAAAFVFLVGYDTLSKQIMPVGSPERNRYKNIALQTLRDVVNVDNECFRDAAWWDKGDVLQYRSKELINFIQAYDMLRTAIDLGYWSDVNNELDHVSDVRYDKLYYKKRKRGKLKNTTKKVFYNVMLKKSIQKVIT